MKEYAVFVREVHIQEVRVEADDEETAREMVVEGEGDYVDNTLEYSHSLEPETWIVEVVGLGDGDESLGSGGEDA